MTKGNIIRCILSVLLLSYLVAALIYVDRMSAETMCNGLDIVITDDSNTGFVKISEIVRELDSLPDKARKMKIRSIDTNAIEKHLSSIDNIETVECVRRANDRLRVSVIPMKPVARIFDGHSSYYINKDGKELTANARYRVDVPVVVGHCDSLLPATSLLKLLDFIQNDSTWNSLVTAVKIDRNRDIILIPMIRGHVINFGDTTAVKNKFDRLYTMYRKVLPIKGWEYYDTISVKFAGQVVATRRTKRLPEPIIKFDEETIVDEADINTMLTEDDGTSTETPADTVPAPRKS